MQFVLTQGQYIDFLLHCALRDCTEESGSNDVSKVKKIIICRPSILPKIEKKLQVFEKGDLNAYFEYYHLSKLACELLHVFLWNRLKEDTDVSYTDKTIFVEEHALLVASTLHDRFARGSVPLISETHRKVAVMSLMRVVVFLEKVPLLDGEFKQYFRSVLASMTVKVEPGDASATEYRRLQSLLNELFKSFVT